MLRFVGLSCGILTEYHISNSSFVGSWILTLLPVSTVAGAQKWMKRRLSLMELHWAAGVICPDIGVNIPDTLESVATGGWRIYVLIIISPTIVDHGGCYGVTFTAPAILSVNALTF